MEDREIGPQPESEIEGEEIKTGEPISPPEAPPKFEVRGEVSPQISPELPEPAKTEIGQEPEIPQAPTLTTERPIPLSIVSAIEGELTRQVRAGNDGKALRGAISALNQIR